MKALRAALASDAEPVYQVMSCGDVWQEVSKETYDETGFKKRVLYTAPPSTAQAVEAASNSWRKVAAEAFEAWDSDNDSRLGKLLRAMSDPVFARQYRKYIAALHDTPAIPTEAAQVERDAKDAEPLAALEDSLVMIGRLKKHCQITDNAGYTADGRMLTLTGVEERARAAIASAKREGKACSGD